MARGITIGTLAKAAGVNVETIRYYQRLGLVREPSKPAGGHRQYPPSAVQELAFIRRAQRLGFVLAEIKQLLRLAEAPARSEVRKIAQQRCERLHLQARQLGRMARNLGALLERSRRYKGRGPDPITPCCTGEKRAPGDKPVL